MKIGRQNAQLASSDFRRSSVHSNARNIYCDSYVREYPSLYIDPWPEKHRVNVVNLSRILANLGTPTPRWLDLACGQAWHFSAFPGRARMLGVDISEAQLARARERISEASFVCADMREVGFRLASFDLVTNFWAGYCYLGNKAHIATLVRSALSWIAPGGALYIEVLLGEDLEAFNRSRFSARTGFVVTPRSTDFSEWEYRDTGGCHIMTSPPLHEFLELIEPCFESVDVSHDGGFMVHLIAQYRR